MLHRKRKEILKLFKCKKSGNCCKCPGYVYVSKQDQLNMAKELEISINEFKKKYVLSDKGWDTISTPHFRNRCFLEGNSCLVYNSRPKSCRTYPNWDSIWESEHALLNESTQCPGLEFAIKNFQNVTGL